LSERLRRVGLVDADGEGARRKCSSVAKRRTKMIFLHWFISFWPS
jgi:hypothetical protein